MKLNKIKLLPCNKCKQENFIVKTEKLNNLYKSYVWCLSCHYCGETASRKSRKEAEATSVKLWNGEELTNNQTNENNKKEPKYQNKAYGLKISICPKCGENKPIINSSAYNFGQRHDCYISCSKCFYKGLIFKEHTKKLAILNAIQYWNTNK